MSAKKIAVIVAGSWGTALANVLADNGHQVMLWTRNSKQADEINNEHRNARFLGEHALHPGIQAVTSIADATEGASALLLAAPTSAMRQVVAQLQPYVKEDMIIIHASKGFEAESLLPMSSVIAEELPQMNPDRIVVLSGPSHAEEVIVRNPTTIVVAATEIAAAEAAQDLFINSYFRVYTNPDIRGVEVAGALKNIIAFGAGMSDGLQFGDNAKAALLTRGLAEISRLGTAMGANPMTFAGLAGVGDLVVTCTSKHSRNWRAGYAVAQGKSLQTVLEEMGMVVEGVRTTKAAVELAKRHHIDMPIAEQLYCVLFEGKQPKHAVEDLMGRVRTHELEEIAESNLEKWTN
jgi:glycerol-3-phosphate dehydrogenase (NAD(P)+)